MEKLSSVNPLFIKNAINGDPAHKGFGKPISFWIKNNRVLDASHADPKPEHTFDAEGIWCAPGFFDFGSQWGIPGQELSETLETGLQAALAGGFTESLIIPGTCFPLNNAPAWIGFTQRYAKLPITCHVAGAITQDAAGKHMAELLDLASAGARIFSDGDRTVEDTGTFRLALEYGAGENTLFIHQPRMSGLSAGAQVSEGMAALNLGLPGIPAEEEFLGCVRDLTLARYLQRPLHLQVISSASALNYIKEHRFQGVSIGTSVMHLCFNEQYLSDFNTNFKIYPPLRAESDRKALVNAVCEGELEIVTAHHRPVHSDEKDREFGVAAYGASGLETCFRALLTLENEGLTLKRIIEILALNPRKLLGLEIPGLKPASPASFTFFKTSPPSAITRSTLKSRSHNNPFIGSELPGELVGIFHGGRMIF